MHIRAKYLRTSVALVAVVVALVVPATRASASNLNPGVLPPQSHPFGLTYSEWSARWWQWNFSIPVHSPPCPTVPCSNPINHPLVDTTGAKCGVGQSGSVWFLGGVTVVIGEPAPPPVTRHCTVPPGKALFFPPLNIECSLLEAQDPSNGCGSLPETVDALRAIIAPFMDEAAHLSAAVDGKPITISPNGTAAGSPYRVMSPVFSFTLPSDTDNVFTNIGAVGTFPAGTHSPMVGDGFYVMLAPLSAGQHTVHFHGEVPSIPFVLDITYDLTIAG